MLTGSVFIITLNALIPDFGGYTVTSTVRTYITGIALGILGWVCLRRPDRLPDAFWVAVPVLAIALIGIMDYLSADAGVGGQLFFLWPALYAATFLRIRVVVFVLSLIFVTDFALVLSIRDLAQAIWDTTSIVIGVSLASVIIWTLRKRVDKLLMVLESQALTDTLTGLANRRAFDRDIDHAIAHARRTSEPMCLLTLDVDNFKSINDTWGHAVGDEALLSIADALSSVTREADVVARLGGDEFVALLTDCDARNAARVADAFREAVPKLWRPNCPPATVSIGIAGLPIHADTRERLISASDRALYEAKARGRNQAVVATPD